MIKAARLRDFQLYARPTRTHDGDVDPLGVTNLALFASYEPVRLWLREQKLAAPFQKLLVTLVDREAFSGWHGSVTHALGVCEVFEAVDMRMLRQAAGDHRWVLSLVDHALSCVARDTGWTCADLAAHIAALTQSGLPLVHVFQPLARQHKPTGSECVPWLSTQPSLTRIGVRLVVGGRARDVVVASRSGPLFLEDDFPMTKSALKDGEFRLLTRTGEVLARVPVTAPDQE